MKALIQKEALSVQVPLRHSVFYSLFRSCCTTGHC
jgi:hypothetical protein